MDRFLETVLLSIDVAMELHYSMVFCGRVGERCGEVQLFRWGCDFEVIPPEPHVCSSDMLTFKLSNFDDVLHVELIS